ncbi:hypothetical protein DFH27DRAFT_374914 [Peziza echinospora]|nr:hypothetical protein DFH27DRAFT_374914 [Peziza echinospora]
MGTCPQSPPGRWPRSEPPKKNRGAYYIPRSTTRSSSLWAEPRGDEVAKLFDPVDLPLCSIRQLRPRKSRPSVRQKAQGDGSFTEVFPLGPEDVNPMELELGLAPVENTSGQAARQRFPFGISVMPTASSSKVTWVDMWRKRNPNRTRSNFGSKVRGLWRRATTAGVESVSRGKRRLDLYNSWRCRSYTSSVAQVEGTHPQKKGRRSHGRSNRCISGFMPACRRKWRTKWLPVSRYYLGRVMFWTVEIGTYFLAAPILIPWELCSLVGLLLVRIWRAARDASWDSVCLKVRNHTEWVVNSQLVGIVIGACLRLGTGYAHRHLRP